MVIIIYFLLTFIGSRGKHSAIYSYRWPNETVMSHHVLILKLDIFSETKLLSLCVLELLLDTSETVKMIHF